MAYGAGGAYRLDLDAAGDAQARPQRVLSVVEGGGADARARQGVASTVVARARAVIIVAAALTFLGVARVSITTATVGVLAGNAELELAIEDAEAANSDLRVERSILSSSTRVDRIATQNLGMVPAEDHDVMSIPTIRERTEGDGDGAADQGREPSPDDPQAAGAAPRA